MPLFKTWTGPGFRVGVWRVTETFDALLVLTPCAERLRAEAEQRFRTPVRRLEFAAVRALLYALEPAAGAVTYEPSGRPLLVQSGLELSISHTQGYVAVMLSSTAPVGIDIERQSRRIERVRDRIVGAGEQADSVEAALLHWSAKETAFKLMHCEGVDFLSHLQVRGLSDVCCTAAPSPRKTFQLEVFHPSCRFRHLDVGYWVHPDFVLTYAIESL